MRLSLFFLPHSSSPPSLSPFTFFLFFFLCLSICNTLTSVRFTFASAKTQWYAFNFELFTLVYSVQTPFKLNTFSTQSICFGFEIQCRKKPLNALNWERKKYFYDIKTSINRTRGSERERERDTHKVHRMSISRTKSENGQVMNIHWVAAVWITLNEIACDLLWSDRAFILQMCGPPNGSNLKAITKTIKC